MPNCIESPYEKESMVIKTELKLCQSNMMQIKEMINKIKDRSDFFQCLGFKLY